MQAPEPDGGFAWPLDPAWSLPIINECLEALLHALRHFEIHVPGGEQFLSEREALDARVCTVAGKNGRVHTAQSAFAVLPGEGRKIQVHARRDGAFVILATRESGSKSFITFAKIPAALTPALRSVLAAMGTNKL
jgi:hypothetical protein